MDYPFLYNGYTWKLCCTLSCYGANNTGYPIIGFVRVGTTCYLIQNNNIVYKESRYVNGGNSIKLEDELTFGMGINGTIVDDSPPNLITSFLPTNTYFSQIQDS
nr:MAG TPA: hypothetical protein [Caudoviricetes sp.]